jgi:hypothetical protein
MHNTGMYDPMDFKDAPLELSRAGTEARNAQCFLRTKLHPAMPGNN